MYRNPDNHELFNLYKNISVSLPQNRKFDKFILIWFPDEKEHDIHSTGFALLKDDLQKRISKEFEVPVKLMVKSSASPDTEILRNLKIELSDYKMKNIEVIDHNFTDREAKWIIEAVGDYAVKDEERNYYVVD